jgi:YebC/PmpR family DNA-binding regulatory protein
MAGHSKWANIKHKKGKMDAQKGKVFTKLNREITVAAREGGGDPGSNSRLRLIIEKSRSVNMPQDNIARAIKRGTGELEGVSYESSMYEGYGPSGIAVIVETLTDNKNRTVSDVRRVFTKYGGNLAESGAVSWMFERKGTVLVKAEGHSEDELLEKLLDYNIDDISSGGDLFSIYCSMEDLETVKKGVESSGLPVEAAEVGWVAKNPLDASESDQEKAFRLLDALEELDDVQSVYANLK